MREAFKRGVRRHSEAGIHIAVIDKAALMPRKFATQYYEKDVTWSDIRLVAAPCSSKIHLTFQASIEAMAARRKTRIKHASRRGHIA